MCRRHFLQPKNATELGLKELRGGGGETEKWKENKDSWLGVDLIASSLSKITYRLGYLEQKENTN
jgi:hypothetical protein